MYSTTYSGVVGRRRYIAALVVGVIGLFGLFASSALAGHASMYTIAGTGDKQFSGDNRLARTANIDPSCVVFATEGIVFCDARNHRLLQIGLDGIITTIAGTGNAGFNGDEADASKANISPRAIAVTPDGGFVIVSDDRIREISPLNEDGKRSVTTIAGTGEKGFNGDHADATQAHFSFVGLPGGNGLAVTPEGTIILADSGNHLIRQISAPDGSGKRSVTTIAGTGKKGFNGDHDDATKARLAVPCGLVFASDTSIFFADRNNNRICKLSPPNREGKRSVTTTIGNPRIPRELDCKTSKFKRYKFEQPSSIVETPDGGLFVAQWSGNPVIKILFGSDGEINITSFAGIEGRDIIPDVVPAWTRVGNPTGLATTPDGGLIISISEGYIRVVLPEEESNCAGASDELTVSDGQYELDNETGGEKSESLAAKNGNVSEFVNTWNKLKQQLI